jgi:hypothetical protein
MLDGYGARCMEAEMNVHMVPGIPGHLTRSTVSQHGRKERFHARYPFRLHERFLLDLTCGSLRSQNNTRLTLPICKRVDPQLRGRSGWPSSPTVPAATISTQLVPRYEARCWLIIHLSNRSASEAT